MRVNFFLELAKLAGKVLVRGDELAQLDKGANDIDADINGPWAIKIIGRHDGPVLGEGVGQVAPAAVCRS